MPKLHGYEVTYEDWPEEGLLRVLIDFGEESHGFSETPYRAVKITEEVCARRRELTTG